MKRLKKGFTLIELLVVIAIIGILATTLAPKLRVQLAKAKDSKAIAVLGAARTAGSVALVDKMVSSTSGGISLTFKDIRDNLDAKSNDLITATTGLIPVGLIDNAGTVTYGGTVTLHDGTLALTADTTVVVATGDDLAIRLNSAVATDKSAEGKEWDEY